MNAASGAGLGPLALAAGLSFSTVSFAEANQLQLLAQAEARTQVKTPPAGASPQGPTNWVVTCGSGTSGLDCRALSRLPVTGSDGAFFTVAVRIPPETKQPIMFVLTPLGVDLASGATVAFAGAEARKISFQNCDPSGCLAEQAISAAELDSLIKGRGLTVSVLTKDKQPLSVQVPAAGFSAAYAKIK